MLMTDDLATLRGAIRGRVITAADDGYDDARRVWNGMIDRRPRLDRRGRRRGRRRAGDRLCPRDRAAARDPGRRPQRRRQRDRRRRDRAGPGPAERGRGRPDGAARARRCRRDGSPTSTGRPSRTASPSRSASCPGPGVAGLTLGGGVGWLTRAHGLTIDNLVSADVVLASGEPVRASATEHPDLFWGLRGGGGNFGVVTSFTFRAHALDPDVFAGTLVYERPRWTEALEAFVGWTADAPRRADDAHHLHGAAARVGAWRRCPDVPRLRVGRRRSGRGRALDRDGSRRPARPDVAVLDPTRWITFQSAFDAMMPNGVRAYWRNHSFERLDAELDRGPRRALRRAGLDRDRGRPPPHGRGVRAGRGGRDRVPEPRRPVLAEHLRLLADAADDAARTAWVKGFSDAIRPNAMAAQYVNFLGHDDGDARGKALAVYGPAKVERLVAVKRRYDPDNLFRVNHNIPPDGWPDGLASRG